VEPAPILPGLTALDPGFRRGDELKTASVGVGALVGSP